MESFKLPKKIKKNYKKDNSFKYAIIIILATALGIMLAFKCFLMSLKQIANLESFKPNIVTKFYSSDDEVIKTFTAFRFEKIEINQVSENLKNAFIATEDKNFYSHQGFDLFGLARSSVANVKAGHVVQCVCTITQQ